ncbi:hypothetical protein [Devosia sp.]|uniref:hypothetical protein n=1 Tax=Devosia sp. TaxID=1871048 RepID=UPI0035AF98A5
MIALRTHSSQLPPWAGWLAVGLAGLLMALLLVVALGRPPPVASGPEGAAAAGDLVSYQRIVERLRAGADYYVAAHEVLVADGFGVTSVFNWRLPGWASLMAALPDGWLQGGLAALAVGGLLLVYRMLRDDGPLVAGLASLAVGLSLAGIAVPESAAFSEVAAGTLILVSVAAYGNGWRWAGLAAGLAALFLRELAAPYVVVALAMAVGRRQWREAAGWGIGLAAFAVYFGWHWWRVIGTIVAGDPGYVEGWIQFGGLDFVLATAGFNGLLSLAPEWVTALLMPMALLGLWAWPKGGRALWTVLAFVALFLVVGKPFNAYWGALYTPVLMLGLGWAPAAIVAGIAGARETRGR